jgi:hypothetical protein
MKRVIAVVLAALVFLSACDRSSDSAEAQRLRKELAELKAQINLPPKQQQPTATELFELRTKCAALGENILNDDIIGNALTHSQTARYDTRTGHCYVELTVQTADWSAKRRVYSRYLEDGHTRTMLAFQSMDGDKKTGSVFNKGIYDFEAAGEYIDNMMKEE